MACAMYPCSEKEEYIVACPTTDRLHEQWWSCHEHITRIVRYLKERDEGWGILEQTYQVIEIQEEFAF